MHRLYFRIELPSKLMDGLIIPDIEMHSVNQVVFCVLLPINSVYSVFSLSLCYPLSTNFYVW